MRNALKPCPSCGGKAVFCTYRPSNKLAFWRKTYVTVVCLKCSTATGLCKSKADAAKMWNNHITAETDETKEEKQCAR